MPELEVEIINLPIELKHMGLALVQFASSLIEGTTFQLQGHRWVARLNNFVTFAVHSQRARNIALSLRGNPDEFLPIPGELPLKGGMAGYSECTITDVKQLYAASYYIARAAELYKRGRNRTQKKPVILE